MESLYRLIQKSPISYLTEMCPEGVTLILADGQADMTKLTLLRAYAHVP